jgi:hypothetical protein
MPATKPNPESITPAVAAQQAVWHAKQAADYWKESERHTLSARGRETARRRFIEHTRHALPTAGLETYLDWIRQLTCPRTRDEAAPIIRQLWTEIVVKAAGDNQPAQGEPLPQTARAKLVNAQRLLEIGLEQIALALAAVDQSEGNAAQVETRN